MKPMNLFRARLGGLVAVAVVVTACGSGSGDDGTVNPPVAGSDVPSSATSSSAGATAFVRGLTAAADNTASPINVGDAVLATSDTTEPEGV